jgi:hypothetical protein
MANLVRIGVGEGFATYTGTFEGEPAFIADCGTLARMFDDDKIPEPITLEVFDTEAARDEYIEELRRTRPQELGYSRPRILGEDG